MAAGTESQTQVPSIRWDNLTRLALDRIPLPFWATALLLGLIVLVEQMIEQSMLSPLNRLFLPSKLQLRLVLPALTVYMLMALKTLKTSALPKLAQLRPSVQIDDAAYDESVRDIVQTTPRAQAILLLVALTIVVAWFVVLRLPYPMMAGIQLPANLPLALLTIVAYTIFGWSGLCLVASSLRFGWGLGRLARQPLSVNVLDPENLLPFGRLSLRHSLTVAVTILLFVIPLGAPGDLVEYTVVLLASLASFSALVLPLWGVHSQMEAERANVAAHINNQLAQCQSSIMSANPLSGEALTGLADRTDKLVALRTTIHRSPTWPFRNLSSVVRVVLAALSPLLYFVLNEVIRTYILPILGID